MPIYEYQCNACGQRFEQIQKFADAPIDVCPMCGKATVQRLLSAPAFQFKGSGWYITDYAKKSGDSGSDKTGAKTEKSEKSDKGESSTTTSEKTESKPAASEPKKTSDA